MQDKPVILCADDDSIILGILRYILEGAGYRVVTAENGVEALDVARTKSVDLAILDIRMPGMSGIEVLKALRARDPDFYVIMVSSVENISITLDAMGQGALDYIVKPIDVFHLLVSVKKALELKDAALLGSGPAPARDDGAPVQPLT